MDYRYGSHTVYQLEYHFVWVTKYRYPVLRGDVAERVRELVRQTCDAFEIRIVRGVVSKDHVHILVSAPPTLAPSEITPCVRMKVLCPWRDLCDDGASPNRGRLATGGAPVRSPQGDWTADPRRARREALGT